MVPRRFNRPSGEMTRTGPFGEVKSNATLTCCHCQATWIVKKGSGIKRGFCQNCMGYTCGNPTCEACVPAERQIENIEAGRPLLTPCPASVFVPDMSEIQKYGSKEDKTGG